LVDGNALGKRLGFENHAERKHHANLSAKTGCDRGMTGF
jgi:hypothetical protein